MAWTPDCQTRLSRWSTAAALQTGSFERMAWLCRGTAKDARGDKEKWHSNQQFHTGMRHYWLKCLLQWYVPFLAACYLSPVEQLSGFSVRLVCVLSGGLSSVLVLYPDGSVLQVLFKLLHVVAFGRLPPQLFLSPPSLSPRQ